MVKPVATVLRICPNPFSKLITISFGNVQGAKSIELKIYDATGRLVRQWDYPTIRQSNQISWDGRDDQHRRLPSGVYFVKLQAGDYKITENLILLR